MDKLILKYVNKIILITLLFILLGNLNSYSLNFIYHDTVPSHQEDAIDNPEDWYPGDAIISSDSTFMTFINRIIGFARVLGSVISLLVLVIIGIKYILGSVEEKADYKKSLFPYFIGAILVFGISTILGFVQTILTE